MKILVIGDIILDINYFSLIERYCPENSKIAINKVTDIEYILGGASNVANNLNSLNVDVELIGILGNDINSIKVNELLNSKKIKNKIFIDDKRKTTTKNRIFLQNELVSRYDIEDTHEINTLLENQIINYIFNISDKIDAIILSDYNKGLFTENFTQIIINYCNNNNIFSFIDPKIKNIEKYKNCFLIKPNQIEAETITNETNLEKIFQKIDDIISPKHILLTKGKNGMILNSFIDQPIIHDNDINTIDVTGAGDIVISILVYMFLMTNNLYYSAKVSNYISGLSTTFIGNYNILNYNIIEQCISNMFKKIIYDYESEKINFIINFYKHSNLKIIFTNGCFDILHSAHIKLLQYAKNQGDILIVGLNSDKSIKNIKGNDRPINDINERKTILSLFSFIDYLIIFDEDTPLSIIKEINPNIIVKGGDYNKNDIIGKEYCDEILLFNYISNKSSTNIINKIKSIK